MTVRFEHEEIETLLDGLAESTGRDREAILLDVLRKERERLEADASSRREAMASARLLRERVNALPLIDPRPIDEILAYDENGLPA